MTIVLKLMMMMTKGGNHWTLDWTILQCSSSPLKTHDDADIQRLASVVWGGWEKPRFGGDIFWLFGDFQCLEIISKIKQLIKARRSNFGSTNCWWASGDEHVLWAKSDDDDTSAWRYWEIGDGFPGHWLRNICHAFAAQCNTGAECYTICAVGGWEYVQVVTVQ